MADTIPEQVGGGPVPPGAVGAGLGLVPDVCGPPEPAARPVCVLATGTGTGPRRRVRAEEALTVGLGPRAPLISSHGFASGGVLDTAPDTYP
jgi:hypothetical protein